MERREVDTAGGPERDDLPKPWEDKPITKTADCKPQLSPDRQRCQARASSGGVGLHGRGLHMMAGSKEDAETVTAFFEDMKRRGLNDSLLATSDGAPGIIKAIEVCCPRAARQRCLAHRMRNLAAKVPEDIRPEFKVRAQAAYQAPSRAIARELLLYGACLCENNGVIRSHTKSDWSLCHSRTCAPARVRKPDG